MEGLSVLCCRALCSAINAVNDFQIEYGTRFYGYQEIAGECSYASVDVGNEQGPLSSLTFTFKTKEESGVLLYSRNEVSEPLKERNRSYSVRQISLQFHLISSISP